MGHHSIPLHASAVAQHASVISSHQVGEQWVHRFQTQHSELKMKWTMGLEKCHAQPLNPAAVLNFYDTLNDLVMKYEITKENIYNMDEKGIQLGMGKRVHAMVD